jgi:hypothetical protein
VLTHDGLNPVKRLSRTRGSGPYLGLILGPSNMLTVQHEQAMNEPVTLYGTAPDGAHRVSVSLRDGTVLTAPVTDGWWLLVLPAGTDFNAVTRLEAPSALSTALSTGPLTIVHSGDGDRGGPTVGGEIVQPLPQAPTTTGG